MKTFYCVVSTFDNKGRCTANIVDTIQAEEKPESGFKETKSKDIYTDWFSSKKEAEKFVKATYNA